MLHRMQDATKIRLEFNPFAKGYTPETLRDTFYRLTCDPKQQLLILEAADFEDMDAEYGGEELTCDGCAQSCSGCAIEGQRDNGMVMEAVRVRQFSRTAQTMAALARALNRFMADKGLTVGEATIGRPKKSGLFATVTVQFPVSDGQTITIVFHSPDNNKLQITSADEILAFRWLLNKRDITVAVAPEGEADVSLDEVGKRVAMLVEKNTKAFAAKSKEIAEQKQQLADTQAQVTTVQTEVETLQATVAEMEQQSATLDTQIQQAQGQLAKVQEFNAGLQTELDALAATAAGNAGKAVGGTATPEEIQAEQEANEFATKRTAFEAELVGRGIIVANAYDNGNTSYASEKFPDPTGSAAFLRITVFLHRKDKGVSIGLDLLNGEKSSQESKEYTCKTLPNFDGAAEKALDWIDKKLAAMKKDVTPPPPVEETTGIDTVDGEVMTDGPFSGWKLTAQSALGVQSDTVNVYNAEGTILGYVLRSDVDAFKGGDLTSFRPVDNWKNTFSVDLQVKLGLREPTPATPDTTDPGTGATPEETEAVAILTAIVNREYADSGSMGDALDDAAAKIEGLGLLEKHDALLNAAADAITAKLREEAAGV